MISCFILSLSAVSAIDEEDNSTVILEDSENVAINQEINQESVDLAINSSDVVLSPTISNKTIEITQDNYDNYFYKFTGQIKNESGIVDGDVLKIGNISNRGFVIDRQLTLMPLDNTSKISNGFVHLVKGSDGSTISGLTINNTKGSLTVDSVYVGQLHGIWLTNSNNNTIINNIIRIAYSGGVYAMPMGWSSYNRIIGNDMSTYVTSVMLMGSCHYNLISKNKLETLDYNDYIVSNLIYFNPFDHADYSGSALCVGNTITDNYLKAFCNGVMSIVLQLVYENHVNTTIANNIIIRGNSGINLNGDNSYVFNNTVIDSTSSIIISGKNTSVTYNNITGSSQGEGIVATGGINSSCIIAYNNITYTDMCDAISVANYTKVFNNTINIKNYGVGISIIDNCSYVYDNKVKVNHDTAITFKGNNNTVSNNVIDTNEIGIAITSLSNVNRYYYNCILNNVIRSGSYGISIKGLVYKTTISGNVIETNATIGVYKEITDELSNNESDNMVNGVIYDATALVINDDNFYKYFDKNGYLNYTFDANKSKVIFFTFLSNKDVFITEKISIISNKQSNLLFNVSISLSGDASGSIIRDFNFYNMNKEAIILNGVDTVSLSNNNITLMLKDKSPVSSAISVINNCNDVFLKDNNIYVNSKADYAYAMSISNSKAMSSGFEISGNTIIIIGTGVCEGIYSDVLVESKIIGNNINIISDGAAYGIASCNVIGAPHNLNISNNNIVIHSKDMAYLIELHKNYNVTLVDNYLYGNSSGIYGIGTYMSNNISIINNTFNIFGGNLSKITEIHDTLGIGQGAIGLIKFTNNTNITGNLIYANITTPIFIANNTSIVEFGATYFVIDDDNYEIYSNNDIIKNNDVLLLNNLTKSQNLNINIPVNIISYRENVSSIVNIIINSGASSTNITNLALINSTITLNNVSKVHVKNNTLTNSSIAIVNGMDNYIANNGMYNTLINLVDTSLNHIISNNITFKNLEEVIIINNSSDNEIIYNNFSGIAKKVVNLIDSSYTNFNYNSLNIEGFGYYAYNSSYDSIKYNNIVINGTGNVTNQSAIFFTGKSLSNEIMYNNILSYDGDYAVMIIASENLFNKVVNNYLISGNGSRRANEAVYALYDLVKDNTPYAIYVAINGSDIAGDGTIEHPYASLAFALVKSLNHCVIYLLDGTFKESNLIIDKNITILVINPGHVFIDANNSQLFTILNNGTLQVSGLIIANGHNVIGGSLFINNGTLYINNSLICNSSAYFDNSNPEFVNKIVNDRGKEYWYTVDCKNTGLGGAILNYGELFINSTELSSNYGHKGGAIADFGRTTIYSTVIRDNYGVHGGAIYTDSSKSFTINNTVFYNNTAIIMLDYCMISKSSSGWSIYEGVQYKLSSVCGIPLGVGGAIFNKNTVLDISNSIFDNNNAYKGGAIGGSYGDSSTNASLNLNNCSFTNNVANSTFVNNDSNLDSFEYKNYGDGGAIYGTYNKLNLKNSALQYNKATNDGGALYVQANDGRIDGCIITNNRAGSDGGALAISNNFLITNTVISNNSASYGGAISYSSSVYYGHTQNNLNIFNSTISNNVALEAGGAFYLGPANVVIHNSNLVNNKAPRDDTFNTYSSSDLNIDARYNYWETDGKKGVPDDSPFNLGDKIQFKPLIKSLIHWEPSVVPDNSGNGSNPSDGGNNPNPSSPTNTKTNPSWHTSTQIGNGGNTGGISPVGPSSHTGGVPGPGGNPGSGDGGNYGPAGGTEGSGTSQANGTSNGGTSQGNGTSQGGTPISTQGINGSSNANSLSQIDGSSANANLVTVGLTANAASSSSAGSSTSSSDGKSSSASSSSASEDVNVYELDKDVTKQLDNPNTIFTFIGLIIVLIICLFIGYKRRKDRENE